MNRKMLQLWNYVYSIYENWDIYSEPKYIERIWRRGKSCNYYTKRIKLVYDIKETDWHKLARVKLYDGEWRRYNYYVSKLVYAKFNGIPYKSLKNIHYKDWNTLNCSLDNLYPTDWIIKD